MISRHSSIMTKRDGQPNKRKGLSFFAKALLGAVFTLVTLLVVDMSISLESVRLQGLKPATSHSRKVTSENIMSSCMLIMDDNHWLVEWLAYHYMSLNLRHLIIAIDPRSISSPISILDRWKSRIDFELWNDSHYFDNHPGPDADLQQVNLARQQTFLAKCMQEYKRRNHSWLLFTDTDEFVVINPYTRRINHSLYRPYSPTLNQSGSILSFLQHEQKTRGTTCFSMGRLQFSPDEDSPTEIQKDIPPYFNASQFMTLRWLHPAHDLVGPKNIVDLSKMHVSVLPTNYTHQHRVILTKCPEAGHAWHRENSLLQVYHYLGTLEQHNFRKDARLSLEWAGRNERFAKYRGAGSDEMRDDLRPWIKAFVDSVGKKEAIRLLEGVGRTEGWESATAHADRFAQKPCCISTAFDDVKDIEESNYISGSERKTVYSVAKTDRSGAAVADMLLAHAYAFANKMRYAGACPEGNLPYRKNTEQLIEAVGLQDDLQYACPEDGEDATILGRQTYVTKNTRIFTRNYLDYLHSRVTYPATKNHSVVVHVRRGDITPCNYFANRYLPNSHYMKILQEYIPPELPVSIFSEAEAFEPFDDFANYSIYLDADLPGTWKAMILADYIVLSKSSFSLVPAILNPNATVIYTPFMQKKLPHWTTVGDDIMENTYDRVLELIEQRCTPEEKEISLLKLSS